MVLLFLSVYQIFMILIIKSYYFKRSENPFTLTEEIISIPTKMYVRNFQRFENERENWDSQEQIIYVEL